MVERKSTKKRCLFGYSVKETNRMIQSLQAEHQNEMEQLQNAINAEKEKREQLIEKLADLPELPITENPEEEVMQVLRNQYFQQTRSIKETLDEGEKRVQHHQQQLEDKLQQKELAQRRIQEVLEFLHHQKNEWQKELNQ